MLIGAWGCLKVCVFSDLYSRVVSAEYIPYCFFCFLRVLFFGNFVHEGKEKEVGGNKAVREGIRKRLSLFRNIWVGGFNLVESPWLMICSEFCFSPKVLGMPRNLVLLELQVG